MRLVFFAVFYLLTASYSLYNPKKVLKLFILYIIGLVPVMYFTFMKHWQYDFNLRSVSEICAPYFDDHTIYAACLAFVIPMALIVVAKRHLLKLSSFLTILVSVIVILLIFQEIISLSRAALLSLIITFLFYLFLKLKLKSYALLFIVAGTIASGVIMKDYIYSNYIEQSETVSNDGDVGHHLTSVTNLKTDASNLERINRWVCAIDMFKEKPITGFGPGTYQFEYGRFQTTTFRTYISTNHGDAGNAHSEYLTYLSETGLPGFLIFILIVFYSVYLGIKVYHRLPNSADKVILLGLLLGLVTFFSHGIVNSFIDQDKMAFLVFSALAGIVVIDLKTTGQNTGKIADLS